MAVIALVLAGGAHLLLPLPATHGAACVTGVAAILAGAFAAGTSSRCPAHRVRVITALVGILLGLAAVAVVVGYAQVWGPEG